MRKGDLQYDDLSGFERLDPGELYFLAPRQSIEKGLACYRNYHVESLSWDDSRRTMCVCVAGSGMDVHEVRLRTSDEKIIHGCNCPDWSESAGCKHVVAAVSAMFLAVQGKSAGDYEMPADYAQELREGLGYRDVGLAEDADPAAEVPQSDIVLVKIDLGGTMQFRVGGDRPHQFLRSAGVSIPDGFYGYSNSREFTLQDPEDSLRDFLQMAEAHGIPVRVEIEGSMRALRFDDTQCREQVVLDWTRGYIVKRRQFLDSGSVALDTFQRIEGTRYVILQDGRIATCVENVDGLTGGFGHGTPESGESILVSDKDSNQVQLLRCQRAALDGAGGCELRINGVAAEPRIVEPEQTMLQLKLEGLLNAADELEGLCYRLSLRGEGTAIDLGAFSQEFFQPLLTSTGPLLGAKYRVRAFFELIRRMLSTESEAGENFVQQPLPARDFPDLLNQKYGYSTQTLLRAVLRAIESSGGSACCLAVNAVEPAWLALPLDARKVAMLLFSLSDVSTRDEIAQLHGGVLPVPRGQDPATALQRTMTVCRALGVEMVFNNRAVESAKVSIDFRGSEGDTGIDWFELHPSIRCGDRTLSANEWKQLIHGKLLLRGADGNWLMPEFADADADGVRMLADWLERETRKKEGTRTARSVLQISRLEMLDWIALRKRGMKLTLPEEAESVFESLMRFDSLDRFVPPTGLKAELRSYQNEGCAWIDFLYRHRFGACLADDMGLGKTVQTIAFLVKRLTERTQPGLAPVLIVLPPSLVFNWIDEFARFAPDVKVVEVLSRRAFTAGYQNADVLLTTYDRVRVDIETFKEKAFDIVVFDEAHNLKNVSAARTRAAAKLRRRFTLCLTGTPVENNVSEFFSVMTMAVPGIFGMLKDFKDAFRDDPDRLLARARPFILRRKKEKILKELPAKEEHELFLEMSPLQREIYTRTVAEVKAEIAHAYEGRPEQQAGIVALAAILRLRQVCVSPEILGKPLEEPAPKFAYMAEKLEELRAEGHAALVFSQFRGGLLEMEKVAAACGFDYLRMDGQTPVSKRRQIVADFQANDGPPFFFISLKTGGVGLNLTRANYVFHLDPWWNPAVENQASDRAHRIGQTRSVFVQRLIMRHTIEERMLDLKARKARLFQQLIDEPGRRSAGSGLSRSDFEFLIDG